MRFAPGDYVLRPGDYLVAILLLGLGFLVREFVFRAGGSLWEDLRHLFDIEVPKEFEGAVARVASSRPKPLKRRSCQRCGSAMPFNATSCDTCERLGIPPAPVERDWEPPQEVAPVDFASHSTWAQPRATPHRVLGPAVLRLKIAMATLLFAAAWNVGLSGFIGSGWFRSFLLASAVAFVFILFPLRRKSVAGTLIAGSLIGIAGAVESQQPKLGLMLLALRVMTLIAIVQAVPAARRLLRAEQDKAPDLNRAA